MNEKEKKAIEICKSFTPVVYVEHPEAFGSRWQVERDIRSIEAVKTVLNLIEKQQAEIEQLQKEAGYKKCVLCGKTYKPNKKDQLYCSKSCCNKVMCKRYKLRKKQKIEKQDKIINLMAEQLTTPVHSKEWVIEHFNQKIEKGE